MIVFRGKRREFGGIKSYEKYADDFKELYFILLNHGWVSDYDEPGNYIMDLVSDLRPEIADIEYKFRNGEYEGCDELEWEKAKEAMDIAFFSLTDSEMEHVLRMNLDSSWESIEFDLS